MKKYLFFFLLLMIIKLNAQNNSINIIPQPVKIEPSIGYYELTSASTICFNNADGKRVAEMLIKGLNVPTGFSLKAKSGNIGNIRFIINQKNNIELGKEGYILEVNSGGVTISANHQAGLLYGYYSLLQLLPKEIESKIQQKASWKIPFVKVTDYPRFTWRGVMLDVSRHFFSKEEVKKYIDQISRLKYNVLHWHLTDDNGWRIEIKSYPKLTSTGAWRVFRAGNWGGKRPIPQAGEEATYGGFYTQEDIKEIVKYAEVKNVTIIPEIDVPGHCMAVIAAYPELSCTKDTNTFVSPGCNIKEKTTDGSRVLLYDNTLNPSDENVYVFLDKVFSEVASLFPSSYIHVGGDECYTGFWEKDPACIKLMETLNIDDPKKLQGYFLKRVEKIIKAKGKKIIGWDEILENNLSQDVAVMSWRNMQGGIEAAKTGHFVVMTPKKYAYLDFYQGDSTIEPPVYNSLKVSKSYSFEPLPDDVEAKYILGGQANLWTEKVPTFRHVEYMTYPRAWALADVYWSTKESKNWNHFAKRMEAHFERADYANINYCKAVYDAGIKTSKSGENLILTMTTELSDLDIFYTIDGTMPDSKSIKYSQPVELPLADNTLRAITYRNGKPIGHLITLNDAELRKRIMK